MANRTIKDYPNISLDPASIDGLIDFEHIFGRSGGIHIEIGSGKGTFLVSEATAYPDNNYLGIEWANKYYKYAVDRMGRWGIDNVRIMRTDAADFLAMHVRIHRSTGSTSITRTPGPRPATTNAALSMKETCSTSSAVSNPAA